MICPYFCGMWKNLKDIFQLALAVVSYPLALLLFGYTADFKRDPWGFAKKVVSIFAFIVLSLLIVGIGTSELNILLVWPPMFILATILLSPKK